MKYEILLLQLAKCFLKSENNLRKMYIFHIVYRHIGPNPSGKYKFFTHILLMSVLSKYLFRLLSLD